MPDEPPAEKPREACAWELDEDDGSYDTECGQKFVFIDGGGPRENQMRFCCYCGGKLVAPHAAPTE